MSLGILNVTIKNFIDEENDNLKKNFVAPIIYKFFKDFTKTTIS